MNNQTAVEWFYNIAKCHIENDSDLLETLEFTLSIAKAKEREQHGRTWDNAIEAHDNRGYIKSRSISDFDNYEIH